MRDTRYHKILWEATINQRNDHALILDITKSYKNTWWPTTQRNPNAWYHFSRKSMGSNKKSKKWSRTDLRYYKILQEQMMINDTTNISCVLSDIIDIYGKHQKIREMIMHWSQILQNSTRTNDDQRHNETIMRDIRYHRNLWEATNNQRNDHALISDITFSLQEKWSRTDLRYYKTLQKQIIIKDTTKLSCVISDMTEIYGKQQKKNKK